jgi:hypothetical protein
VFAPIGPEPYRVQVAQRGSAGAGTLIRSAQELYVIVIDPLSLRLLPRVGDVLPIELLNPAGTPLFGRLVIQPAPGEPGTTEDVIIAEGQQRLVQLRNAPSARAADKSYTVSARLTDDDGFTLIELPARRFQPLQTGTEAMEVIADGDPKVASEQSFAAVDAPAGLPANGASAIKLTYRFGPGWKFVCLKPRTPEHQTVEGTPTHLGVWVKGDGSSNFIRMRFNDSTGQTFQPNGDKITYTDWRYVEFPLDGTGAGYWGGATDGVVHYPIRLDTLFLLDSADRQQTAGTVYLSSPTLVYSQ